MPELINPRGSIFVDGVRFTVVVVLVVVDAADPAYEIAPTPALGPLINNLTSSLLRLGDTCSAASWAVALAACTEIPTTEEVGRALRDGPADADAEEEELEGQRREPQDFSGGAEGGGATGVATDVEGAASGGGIAGVEGVGTTMVFSVDTRIFDAASSAGIESTSLLNPTSFPSLVLATDNEVCDDAGEPVWAGVSVVSVTFEDGTVKFVRGPGASSVGSGCCERSIIGLISGVEDKRGVLPEGEAENVEAEGGWCFEIRAPSDDVGGRTGFWGDNDAGCECGVLRSARPDGPFCGTRVGDGLGGLVCSGY